MRKVSKSGGDSAIRIFVSHYYDLTWLREFTLKCKFEVLLRPCVTVANVNGEYGDNMMEEGSEYSVFMQMLNDLFFLVRFSVDLFPTARNLWLMMQILDDLNDGRLRSYHNDEYYAQDIYFYANISSKMNSSQNRLSNLWLYVGSIPLKKQKDFDIYALAKHEEAVALGYPTSYWKDLLNNDHHEEEILNQNAREQFTVKSTQQEWKQCYEAEAWKTRKDLIQHLQSKSPLNGNWNLVLNLQLQDVSHRKEFIRAFCGETFSNELSLSKQHQKPTLKLWGRLYQSNFRKVPP
jgi:uncharacterized protein YaaR (DUF327 family)